MRLKISRVRSWGQLLLQEAMELFHPKHLGEVSGRFLQPKQIALFFDLAQVLISYPNVPLRGAFGDPCLLVAFVTFRHVTVPRSVPAFAQSSVATERTSSLRGSIQLKICHTHLAKPMAISAKFTRLMVHDAVRPNPAKDYGADTTCRYAAEATQRFGASDAWQAVGEF